MFLSTSLPILNLGSMSTYPPVILGCVFLVGSVIVENELVKDEFFFIAAEIGV